MSKINAVRIVNFNYNNNSIRIDDESFFLNGESTLISLRNGGGKTVLIQLLTALFVNKKARDTSKRKFASYFTSTKPTFLFVEWVLDGGGAYALTGMMVRKRVWKAEEENEKEELDLIYFVTEYQKPNIFDIRHFPIIEEKEGKKALKGYVKLIQMMEKWKNEKEKKFFLYDMNIPFQARAYFSKIEEYQIFRKEWENVIRKVNIKESGLSELFTNATDERGLVEKWFLDAVEDKLNKEESKIKNFIENTKKFILQYKENKSKLEKKDKILEFKEKIIPIRRNAEEFLEISEEKEKIRKKIGGFYKAVEELKEKQEEELRKVQDRINEYKNQLYLTKQEALSYEIYQLSDEKMQKEERNLCLSHNLKNNMEEQKSLEKRKNILECAKIYREYIEQEKEVKLYKSKRELAKSKEEELKPEREQLGYTLRCHYEEQGREEERRIQKIENLITTIQASRKELEERIEKNQRLQNKIEKELGGCEEKIKGYAEEENKFLTKYQCDFSRNILGEYEQGFFERKKNEEAEGLKLEKKKITDAEKEKEKRKEENKSILRQIEDIQIEQGKLQIILQNLKEEENNYEEQIAKRETIIQHIGFSKEQIFQTKEILEGFEKKIKKIQEQQRILYQEKENLEKEYKKLESGKLLELPKEIQGAWNSQGISLVFGMEWLKKNGKSIEENKEIVQKNPFIPYSIILEEEDIKRLKQKNLDLYTSFPIPIIRRQELTKAVAAESEKLIETKELCFYIFFNDNLLDSKEQKKILLKKQKQIEKIGEKIAEKEIEIDFLKEKKEQVLSQSLTEERYSQCKKKRKETQEQISSQTEQNNTLRTQKHQIENILENLEKKIREVTKNIYQLEERQKDFESLEKKYQEYQEKIKQREELKKTKENLEQVISRDKVSIEDLKQEEEEIRTERERKNILFSSLQKKIKQYQLFQRATLIEKPIEEIEARFEAIASDISMEEKQIEELLKKAVARFEKIKEELIYKKNHAKLKEEYKDIIYEQFQVEEIERKLEHKKREREQFNEEEKILKGEIGQLVQKLKNKEEKLREELHTKELIPRKNIIVIDFQKQIIKINQEIEFAYQSLEKTRQDLQIYKTQLEAIADYEELKEEEIFSQYIQLEELKEEELISLRRELLKENKRAEEREREKNEELKDNLQSISVSASFQDDFFCKPLETLKELSRTPKDFLSQLYTILESYQQLLDKLMIDIEFLEKEKQNMIEQYLDYIQDIHRNLDKIDKNSSIKIKEKPIKMLEIKQPNWEEQENIYQDRIKKYIEDLVKAAVKRLEQNENMEELLGMQITTKRLYDAVVGIHNVEIKLYKIEEMHQYQITWREVAKNSGGEGFLSAFVVLSSLLSFMRKEDTDIFSEREQGKVLLMDNPFAQTNASHLLIPLMDTAKKNNTQLICLSGLGGESIYNRFDNIYVLTLVPSMIKKGMEFIRSEHRKGEEIQEIETSWIKIQEIEEKEPEQIELFREKKKK